MDRNIIDFRLFLKKIFIHKGTMDALMCGPNAAKNTEKLAREAIRVLKPGGRFFLMSCN
jgi:SAM-dependent methyltransferase